MQPWSVLVLITCDVASLCSLQVLLSAPLIIIAKEYAKRERDDIIKSVIVCCV